VNRFAHATVPVLAVLGTLLLGASGAIELSNTNTRTELWTAVAAGTCFLTAIGLSRGSDIQVLAVRARLLVGTGLAALLAVASLWQATEHSAPRVLLLLIPVFLLFTTGGLALREATSQRRQAYLGELRSRQAGEEAERRRWVRDLHDDTLQELAAAIVLLAAANEREPAVRGDAITSAMDILNRQIHALRRLISRMRPLPLDTLGLSAALEDLAQHARDTSGIDVHIHSEVLPRLPADAETSIYRIVQEALTNAIRHAGARRITIRARAGEQALDVTVRDDGAGAADGQFTAGYGLLGMRERAETLDAQLHITTGPTGTQVHLRVPQPAAGRRAGS
jgi:signal transduction histidine kinase